MAQSKPKRKKYNHNALAMKASARLARNSFLFCIPELCEEGVDVVLNGKFMHQGNLTRQQYDLFFQTTHPWSFIFGVACRNTMKSYFHIEEVQLRNQFKFSDDELHYFISDNVNQVVKKNNRDHQLTPFFIAFPEKRDVNDELVQKLLNWKKVEEKLITPYEFQKLGDEAMQILRQIELKAHIQDHFTLAILNKNNIHNFADLRQLQHNLKTIKGLGEKRTTRITDAYIKVMLDTINDDENHPLYQYEKHRAQRIKANEYLSN